MKLYKVLTMLIMLCSINLFGQEKKIKVACIGDSVTYGSGIEDRENYSYPTQLQSLLGEGYHVGGFGKPGATLLRKGHRPYMDQVEFQAAMDFAGDIAIIHLGLNDTDPRNWPNYRDEFISDYLALIDSVKSANPAARVIIARMTPIAAGHSRFNSGTRVWHEMIQKEIGLVAKAAGVELIDFHEPMYAHPNLLPDNLHPNAEGAGILAKTVYSAITGDYGGLQLPVTYCDGMVLQRDTPLTISGTANAGAEVKVCIKGYKKAIKAKAVADNLGKWSVSLEPLSVARGLTLAVGDGERELIFDNVAVGDVWLCSGQSNMAFMVHEMDGEPSVDEDSDLRFFDMKGRWLTNNVKWDDEAIAATQRLEYYHDTKWTSCSSENGKNFSAIGYYFGKMLRDSLDVPIGLICNAVGGSTTESWIDRHSLEVELPAIFLNWTKNDFIQKWARERAAKNIGSPESGATRHPYEPCYLYEAGILPLGHFPIKGVIWYQGESNAHNIEVHETLFPLLVNSWREYWNDKELPFYFVQLSSIDRPSWTWFRDSQRLLAERIPHCEMAVSSDVGDSLDVHPRNKRPVGERLARLALHHEYGLDVIPSGPLFRKARLEKGRIVVEFDFADGLKTSDGAAVNCVEVAGENGQFSFVEAVIEGDRLVIHLAKGEKPAFIRYAWQPFTRANLVNAEGLPASTFRATVE